MEATAKLNNLRIAPRKIRIIADVIRDKKVEEARDILNFSIKKGSLPLLKLLNSALSNASSAYGLDSNNLYISKITVDEGRKLKRWRPRARGSAARIEKKTSSITLVLKEINPAKKKKAVKKTEAIPEKQEEEKKSVQKKFQPDEAEKKLKPSNLNKVNRIFRRKSI